MVVGVDVPFDTDGCSGHKGHAGLFLVVPCRSDDSPKAHAGKGPEVSRAEVLFPDQGGGEVPKGPSTYVHFNTSVTPSVLHDQAHEADATEADADPSLLGPGAA